MGFKLVFDTGSDHSNIAVCNDRVMWQELPKRGNFAR